MELLNSLIEELRSGSTKSVVGFVAVSCVLASQVRRYQRHQKFKRDFGEATYQTAFAPLGLLGVLFGKGVNFNWNDRFTVYRKTSREVISIEPTLWGEPSLYTNSIEVIRQIGGGVGSPWVKPAFITAVHRGWGENVLITDGVEWRKHRRVLQPAFNKKMYEMVWTETTRLSQEIFRVDNWPTSPGVTKQVPKVLQITSQLALCVILACGFGIPTHWEGQDVNKGSFNLVDAIKLQGTNATLITFAPKWIWYLPMQKLKHIKKTIALLRDWFDSTISDKKAEIKAILEETEGDLNVDTLKKDVFTRLAAASEMDAKNHLTDSELSGNVWIQLLAGHESTGGTLAAALCSLAAYKEEQVAVFEELRNAASSDNSLSFDQYESLVKTRASFVEAVRMYPAGVFVIREAKEGTILQVPNGQDENGKILEVTMPIPKGTMIVGDMIGVEYNPRTFPQPELYNPSRWYGATSDEAYTGFSAGSRVCIGRRFALVEGTCFLANLLLRYEVEPLLQEGEDLEGWKSRVLGNVDIHITLGIVHSPVVFRRRAS